MEVRLFDAIGISVVVDRASVAKFTLLVYQKGLRRHRRAQVFGQVPARISYDREWVFALLGVLADAFGGFIVVGKTPRSPQRHRRRIAYAKRFNRSVYCLTNGQRVDKKNERDRALGREVRKIVRFCR